MRIIREAGYGAVLPAVGKRAAGQEQTDPRSAALLVQRLLNFTDMPTRGKPVALQPAAVLLYVSGLSMNRTAKLLSISLETQHVKAALSAMTVESNRRDARSIVQLLRMGWYRPVHCKIMPS